MWKDNCVDKKLLVSTFDEKKDMDGWRKVIKRRNMTQSSISVLSKILTCLFMISLESPCKITCRTKVSARSEVILRDERRDNKSGVGQRLSMDQFWHSDNISRTIRRIQSSKIWGDRELSSLLVSAFEGLVHLDVCPLHATQYWNLENSDTSITFRKNLLKGELGHAAFRSSSKHIFKWYD